MTENYVQKRIKEIYDAYEQNERTRDYRITMEPINGLGDIRVELFKGIKVNDSLINTEIRREMVIKEGDDLKFIQLWE